MAKIYLDTNYIFDLVVRRPQVSESLVDHQLYFSPLSAHILFYSHPIKVPSLATNKILKKMHATDLTGQILKKALLGPTSDLEDNIQLHSAVKAGCDVFLTNDKKLLKMSSFGKTKIMSGSIISQVLY